MHKGMVCVQISGLFYRNYLQISNKIRSFATVF